VHLCPHYFFQTLYFCATNILQLELCIGIYSQTKGVFMKKFLATALLVSGLIGTQAYGKMIYVTNATPFSASITVQASVKNPPAQTVKAGQTVGFDIGGNLHTGIVGSVDVANTLSVGHLPYRIDKSMENTTQVEMGKPEVILPDGTKLWYKTELRMMEAQPYSSSGQTHFEHFFLIGPINRAPHFRIGRLVN
jgi:hypothetical protein